jgi:hypothetical protein
MTMLHMANSYKANNSTRPSAEQWGCYFMNVQAWTWIGEHEQGNIIEFLKNILPMWIRYFKNILSHLGQNIWWRGRIFSMCHKWMIFMDENVDKKWQMMNFFMNIHNKFCFAKKWRKKIRYKKFMLVYCEQFITWNVQVILELLFHIPALQHLNHIKFKLHQIQWHINLLTHQEVCANSNSTFPPQRGIWPLGIETISGTPWHLTILNYFLFSFALSTP